MGAAEKKNVSLAFQVFATNNTYKLYTIKFNSTFAKKTHFISFEMISLFASYTA